MMVKLGVLGNVVGEWIGLDWIGSDPIGAVGWKWEFGLKCFSCGKWENVLENEWYSLEISKLGMDGELGVGRVEKLETKRGAGGVPASSEILGFFLFEVRSPIEFLPRNFSLLLIYF